MALGLIVPTHTGNESGPTILADLKSDMNTLDGLTGLSNFYDIAGVVLGQPAASAEIIRVVLPRAVTFPAALTGSRGSARVAATAETIFSIRKNDVQFGTMTFAISGTIPTFAAASATAFAAGDVLTIIAPATPDATLENIAWALIAAL